MDAEKNFSWVYVLLVSILVISVFWLRLANLGYSNFQGDEIKALCRPTEDQSISSFLLGQRKGPVQFLVTCTYKLFDAEFSNEFFVRLPFSLASILSAFVFYLLTRQFFNKWISIYAALLFATNGLFIAFGRIVQYQSISILCSLIGIYSLKRASEDPKWKIFGLYLGSISVAIGILAHFDSVFVLPLMAYFLYLWWLNYRDERQFSTYCYHLVLAILIAVILLAIFYLPFVTGLNEYQTNYWKARITKDNGSDSLYIFRYYNPDPIVYGYVFILIIGLYRISSRSNLLLLNLWAVPPFIFMEFLVSGSGTHFYTYLPPLFILGAFGIDNLHKWMTGYLGKRYSWIPNAGVILVFIGLFSISHFIYVDHNPEYPWRPKNISRLRFDGGYMEGIFGFPYFRDWREISGLILENYDPDIALITNEKSSLVRFYFPSSRSILSIHQKNLADTDIEKGLIVLWVENPQSWVFKILGMRHENWRNHFQPEIEFRDSKGRLNTSLYYLTSEELEPMFK